TDLPISGATLRAQIPIPVSSKALQLFGFSYRDLDRFYLYEFDGVNLGQFSPTETKLAANANQVLGGARPHSCGRRAAVRTVDRIQVGIVHDRPRSIPRPRE